MATMVVVLVTIGICNTDVLAKAEVVEEIAVKIEGEVEVATGVMGLTEIGPFPPPPPEATGETVGCIICWITGSVFGGVYFTTLFKTGTRVISA